MEQTSRTNSFLTWGIFIVILGLIIWGLVAAQKKASRESANLVLPTQIAENDRSRGSTIASTTLIEYGDFQCPACGLYHPMVEQVLNDLGPDKVRFIFRHFPLPQHGNAVPASRAAEAAGQQGKFWEMYNMLYEKQKSWETAKEPKAIFTGYAKEMGLDLAKFDVDYESDAAKEKIDADYKGGAKGGINQTPTFFVNGKKINSPNSIDEFKKILTDAATTTAQ
jgi:formate-nitrite transporter family protein